MESEKTITVSIIDASKIRIIAQTENEDGDTLVSLSDVRRAIEQTPTADVVEVVCCKDCKFARKMVCGDYSCLVDHRISHDENDFCSYGKRKEPE